MKFQNCKFQKTFANCGVNFQNIVHCHKYSADFTCLISIARELFLQYWLTFRENGPNELEISRVSRVNFTTEGEALNIGNVYLSKVLQYRKRCIKGQITETRPLNKKSSEKGRQCDSYLAKKASGESCIG